MVWEYSLFFSQSRSKLTGSSLLQRAIAAQGFVVAIPDYRLFPEVRYPSFLEDCALAVAWSLRATGSHGGDPGRLALLGHSAGAYNASMLALDGRWLAGAGATGAVKAWAGLAGPYDFLPLASPITKQTFGWVEQLSATQPVNFVRPGAPPAFLAHGDRDRTVAPRHTTKLASLLGEAGVAVEATVAAKVTAASVAVMVFLQMAFMALSDFVSPSLADRR